MAIRRTRSISGDGDTLPYEELAQLVTEVNDSLDSVDYGTVEVTIKQWRSSGDGYGAVEAGFRIEVSW